ncbi:MAG: threonine synthase [Pseudomonadota bacterium]
MRLEDFPEADRQGLIPEPREGLLYRCLGCRREFDIGRLLYTCPGCGSVLLLEDTRPAWAESGRSPAAWRRLFDLRRMLNVPALRGVFAFHEFIAPALPLDSIIYLGEGHTPQIAANRRLAELAGGPFFFKNDGQNPSASFKDRGMACALSYINYLVRERGLKQVLSICASTGDTSAAAALYSSYLSGVVTSCVLLPRGKVTPQQLAQPLGAGAKVMELPGVFDDCMKVVEHMADNYDVALLNSKNAWRILGQESYSFEIAQAFDYDLSGKAVVLPIGNAGNITAVMSGFLKFFKAGIIETLPKVVGVQSRHADPVFRYFLAPEGKRHFRPVTVRPSVAQAAMIGNPVSMPRVVRLAEEYDRLAGRRGVFVVRVSEQEIMDWMLTANRSGHVACTQGGESLAGLVAARKEGVIGPDEIAVADSTAHHLKFIGFQQMYHENSFPPEFRVRPRKRLQNSPQAVVPKGVKRLPEPGKPLPPDEMNEFVAACAREIARRLGLKRSRGTSQ